MPNYSLDLRQRIINAYLAGEGSQRNLAQRFSVSTTTIKTYIKLYRETGNLFPKECTQGRKPAINDQQLSVVKTLLEKQSDMTLDELCKDFKKKTGFKVSRTSMWRAVERLNWSYKKRP